MGAVLARPVDDRYAKAFAKAAKENGGPGDLDVYFGDDSQGLGTFLDDMPVRAREELERGYTATWTMDPWEVAHWYGYDAHTIVEGELARARSYILEDGITVGDVRNYDEVLDRLVWTKQKAPRGSQLVSASLTVDTGGETFTITLNVLSSGKLARYYTNRVGPFDSHSGTASSVEDAKRKATMEIMSSSQMDPSYVILASGARRQ